jgi:hypothetical protein
MSLFNFFQDASMAASFLAALGAGLCSLSRGIVLSIANRSAKQDG